MVNNFPLDKLLYLYDNVIFDINLKTKRIEYLIKKDKTIGQDLSYDEFADLFLKALKLTSGSKEKLVRFLNNLNPSNAPFELPVDYISESGTPVRIIYKGYRYNDDNVLFAISMSDESQNEELDPLTKCYSKPFIIEKIKEAIDAKREFSLMIIDIDNFKLFNDTYGHMFGDIVLVEAAAAVNNVIGKKGHISRIGGDEFLVLYFIDNEYDHVHEACKTIRDSITELSKNNVKQAEITATIGCSSYPKDGDNYDTLFKKADKALYRGKKKGRNCFIMYTVEKCGEINDEDDSREKSIDKLFSASANYNIIAGVLEILNRDFTLKKNLTEAVSLVGSYFLLDRVVLSNQNPDTLENINEIVWYQPRSTKYPVQIPTNEEKFIWNKTLDKTGMLKLIQVHANKDLKVYPILERDKTSSILAFELNSDGKILGLIRFEMCSINRFWQNQNVAALMLIAKMFSIKLGREYRDNKHLKELYFDKTTDIYNYTKWRYEVADYIANNSKTPYSVLDFNISGFRSLNDVLGTKMCDEILVLVANKLKMLTNPDIMYARETDDKFLVFFPRQDKEEIEKVVDDITEYVKDNNHTKKQITFNAGVYFANPLEEIYQAIDRANIARKNLNKSKISYFTNEMDELEKEKLIMEMHMRQAVEDGEFLLYLQPKFDTKKNMIVGAEALTRWNYNFEKILTPNLFIPLFESNGFITELDYSVFENVCKFQRSILDEGYTPVLISVNVSRYQSDFDKYIETIESIRKKYDIPSSLIEIEITEGMYINNLLPIAKFMDDLHKLGYYVSMDDFGAGYSNLSNLASLNFDMIKLDKTFCNDLNNKRETIILSFVMQLAKKLKIKVLCEGVETKEYCDYLKTIGCTLIQGFLFDRPIPAEEFKAKYITSKEKS